MKRDETAAPEEWMSAGWGPRVLRRLSDALPHMAWSARADGWPDYFNSQWYGFTGVGRGETDGENWRAVVHPEDQRAVEDAWQRSTASGEPYEIEHRLRRSDGSWRWVMARALPLRDEDGEILRWVGTSTDVDDARRAADLNRLLSRELGHRIKNLFSVVDGLIQQSAKSTPQLAPVAADLRERIGALARAHDYVRPQEEGSGDRWLQQMLTEILRPYPAFDQGRIGITGDDVVVAVGAATPLALAVHELATNAMKYGALAGDSGSLDLTITAREPTITLTWSEQAPAFAGTDRSPDGFGSGMIDLAVRRQLGGRITREWLPTGLRATMSIPAARLQRQ